MNTLETIIDEIIEHDEKHHGHGVGCACHDEHARKIRVLINERMLNKPGRDKSLSNLCRVLGYIARNP